LLLNQFRAEYNNIMLGDTVFLGAAFALVVEGSPPLEPTQPNPGTLTIYYSVLASSIAMFVVSLWSAVIVTRRLNFKSPAALELKMRLDLREREVERGEKKKKKRFEQIQQAIEWCDKYLEGQTHFLSSATMILMGTGLLALFASAGLLVQMRFNHLYKIDAPYVAFWSIAMCCFTVMVALEKYERIRKKKKEGVYAKLTMEAATGGGKRCPDDGADSTTELEHMQTLSACVPGADLDDADLEYKNRIKNTRLPEVPDPKYLKDQSDARRRTRSRVMSLVTAGDRETDDILKDDERDEITRLLVSQSW
jgi:hypothetical protein